MHEMMTVAIQMYGADALPWSAGEQPDGDPDDDDLYLEDDIVEDVADWPDPVPAPGPVGGGMLTTEGTDGPPY